MHNSAIVICDEGAYALGADKFEYFVGEKHLLGLVTETPFTTNGSYKNLGTYQDIRSILAKYLGASVLVITSNPDRRYEELLNLFPSLHVVRVSPAGYETEVLTFAPKYDYLKYKYFFERLIGLAFFIALLPVMAIIALLIKLDSHGPVIFRQVRMGEGLRFFTIYKFRTMYADAHEKQKELQHLNEMNGGKLFKIERDPRVTRIGKWLRKFSLDELPQFFNIVRGDMTLIGPRPLSTPFNEYKPHHLRRFLVRPGLGAIWQAYHRKETDFERWMAADAEYVEKVSLWFDIKLFFRIAYAVITAKGAR
jgi:lipopolysaccharide/colanic/teichoic acid biosynthesis glycosyltransferase